MVKKKDQITSLNDKDLADLVELSRKKEIGTLHRLLEIHIHNCMVKSFALSDTDPSLAIKRAHYRGQSFMCSKIIGDLKGAEASLEKRFSKK